MLTSSSLPEEPAGETGTISPAPDMPTFAVLIGLGSGTPSILAACAPPCPQQIAIRQEVSSFGLMTQCCALLRAVHAALSKTVALLKPVLWKFSALQRECACMSQDAAPEKANRRRNRLVLACM